jgi:hypothetical protein
MGRGIVVMKLICLLGHFENNVHAVHKLLSSSDDKRHCENPVQYGFTFSPVPAT